MVSCVFGAEEPKKPLIRLNPVALEFARQLIRENRLILDRKGGWRGDKPTRARENEFIRVYGLEAYGKWHLGIDTRHSPGSKSYYKFPFGDFNSIHRCGLLAVKARAHEYGYAEIETAAAQLLQMLELTSPSRQKRVD
jgi:hypothetical protein